MNKAYTTSERLELLENGLASRFLLLASRIDALEKRLDAWEQADGVAAIAAPFDGDLPYVDPSIDADEELANADR